MDALRASYGGPSSDSSDSDSASASLPRKVKSGRTPNPQQPHRLPPPLLALLDQPNPLEYSPTGQGSRVRSFPHVEDFEFTPCWEKRSLHPSSLFAIHIPSTARKEVAQILKKVTSLVPGLHGVDADIPLKVLSKDDQKFEQVALGREFHISLGRTVPIRVHQIDSVVAMLRQKLQSQRRYWIDFSKWEVFVNDDRTRSFLSMGVIAGGLVEIMKQIHAVNEIYRLHILPEFYKDPRPHISLAWASGDISHSLRRVVEEELSRYATSGSSSRKRIFTSKFNGIECKIGRKTYKICKIPEE